MNKTLFTCFAFVLLVISTAFNQGTLDLQGRVIDESGNPLAGVMVDLVGLNHSTSTDAAGIYSFRQSTALKPQGDGTYIPHIRDGSLNFRIQEADKRIKIQILDVRGRQVGRVFDQQVSPGHYDIDFHNLVEQAAPGMYFVKLTIEKDFFVFKGLRYGADGFYTGISLAPSQHISREKRSAVAVDSLHFTEEGYENEVLSLDVFENTSLPDVVMRQGIPFLQHFTGTGKIFNLLTQDTTYIPMENRVHVLLMPDGYTQEFHDEGTYQQDVEDFMEDVFTLTPLNFYKEAFVVWMVPAVSSNVKGQGQTYFDIDVADWTGDMDYAAAQTWAMLDRFPFPPNHQGSTRARNFVVQFLIASPTSGHTTGSGYATSMRHPDDRDRNVGIAIARNTEHEFIHAFSRVSDEYYDRGHGNSGGSPTSNLSQSVNCDDLPWSHLILGGEFNKTQDQLIGVFGPRDLPVNRYHSEFKCKMNGSHHNADLFGGSNNLRVDWMCNWCRELTAYRVYYNSIILQDAGEAWDTWVSLHRKPHYDHFGIHVPDVVPQQNSEGTPWWQPCL